MNEAKTLCFFNIGTSIQFHSFEYFLDLVRVLPMLDFTCRDAVLFVKAAQNLLQIGHAHKNMSKLLKLKENL